jgi:hypothetical protein
MIIGISGYSGSGKDLVGTIIQEISLNKWHVKKWAGKLKTIASILTGIPIEKFEDQEFKKTDLGPEWNMTVRDFLQKLGTDAVRDGLHKNTWVNATLVDYTPDANWIITDTRFPNEAEAIKKAGGIVVRINRPGVQPINPHPSETSLDDWEFDAVINNDGDVADIVHKVGLLLYKHNIK